MSGPAIIGQYRIGERIAIGGAGEIYAAVDTKLGRDVAIKFLV
jgi:eukaryotic-like serine/threonine-protein kinase